MTAKVLHILIIFISFGNVLFGQQIVPIQNYSLNANGQVQLQINGSDDSYYLLQVRNHPDSAFSLTTSITMGQNGLLVLTESLKAYPIDHYQVIQYPINNPSDSDGDGLDDISEYNATPLQTPLNAAQPISVEHALLCLNSLSSFQEVSTSENNTPWVEYLNGMEFLKFIILDFYSTQPKIYFINSNNYDLHIDFANFLGVDYFASSVIKGQIVYHPSALSPNGTLGTYGFNFTNNEAHAFEVVQRTQELLASNMPFLSNNFAYFITENNEEDYQENNSQYQESRVSVLFESDVYAGINYWGLHQSEGYGFFRLMTPGEVPDSRDIVLYQTLPNSLPRVGGIVTSVIQTPLSHVNLRAIHDNIPNAFIRDPLLNDSISNLLNHYIYYKTNQSNYEIREATLDEVNAWYENKRPQTEQFPPLNLSYDSILPLSEIAFDMFDGFGTKVANVATMQSFGFIEGTIPDGFGVPFYFYQEFMKYNGFFDQVKELIQAPDFISDRSVRDVKLAEFRASIEEANLPDWMLNQLAEMQSSFPVGTSIRCRSSSNNEDLPGFSGAGLYDSKTHRPDEGHISKTIKEVYASLWNLRAFEEREFYRVNHFYASMGILCHPNFDDEKVNGVGVSADPLYNTDSTFYLNSQLGEALITNPESTYPEELLIDRFSEEGTIQYSVLQYSSLLNDNVLLMTEQQMNLLRQYLAVIHDQFALLYHAEDNSTFAMDIEFKINEANQLIIKQARPWVSYVPIPVVPPVSGICNFSLFPNPAENAININSENEGKATIVIMDLAGNFALEKILEAVSNQKAPINIETLSKGVYFVNFIVDEKVCKSLKLVKW